MPSKRKRIYLCLYNDDYNSVQYVRYMLTTACNLNPITADQIITICEHRGSAQVTSGFEPGIFVLYGTLAKAGLKVKLLDKKL